MFAEELIRNIDPEHLARIRNHAIQVMGMHYQPVLQGNDPALVWLKLKAFHAFHQYRYIHSVTENGLFSNPDPRE